MLKSVPDILDFSIQGVEWCGKTRFLTSPWSM